MKKVAKKFLCLALVVMMIVPLLAFPVNAEEIEPLFTVNFNGDSNMGKLKANWDGGTITSTPSSDGKSVAITMKGSAWMASNAQLNGLNIQGGSYTFVFTVTASDNNEEIGLLLDHQTGFVVNPGQNTFRYTDHLNGKTPISTTEYNGTGSLTQTYAIEVAGEGEGTTLRGDKPQPNVTITTYKLYNLTQDESGKNVWNLAADISEEPGLDGFFFDWGYAGDCDANVYARFSRDRKNFNDANNATITVSNFKVYEGLVTTRLNPETRAYYLASDGDLLYTANFNGDSTFKASEDWGKMATKEIKNNGKTVVLTPNVSDKASVYGGRMNEDNYPVGGNSYTMVFTATASDEDQEIGLYPDWSTGYVVVPGKNQFKYNVTEDDRTKNTTVVDYTVYDGAESLTQTYAVEFKVNADFTVAEYNLYVAQDGKWVKLYSLDEEELAKTSWGGDPSDPDDETVIRFYRDSKIANQTGTVAVSNVNVYKGFAAKSGAAAVPAYYGYDFATNGDLLYDVNFKGTSDVWSVGAVYDGVTYSYSDDGKAVNLTASKTPSESGSVFGGEMKAYKIPGNAYTVVFTVTAEDADQSVGVFLKWRDGFVVTPGQNSYYLGHAHNNKNGGTTPIGSVYGIEGTYEGSGALTQTYAIEIASGATLGSDTNGDGHQEYECTVYNLYVLQDGVWVLVCQLDAEQRQQIAWNKNDPEFMIHLARISEAEGENAGRVTVSDMKIYKGNDIFENLGLVDGASVRLDNPTGIRFTGSVKKDYYDALVAEYGAENVTIGMLITPTDYLTDNKLAFTKAALDACEAIEGEKYLEIDAKTVLSGNGYYKINCAMVNMNESNYERSFSARLYIKVNGEIVEYSAYNSANNSRSIAEVAERAYNDVKGTQDSVYKYETTLEVGTIAYSPYENREILKDFFTKREQD